MSAHIAFRRQPVPQQAAQRLQALTVPAPTRGLITNENEAFMQAGGAVVQDNWVSTMRGVKLRGGCMRWTDLHALDTPIPPVPDPSRKPVISAFEYSSANKRYMYAANATKVFDVTNNGPPVLVKSGQASGNYANSQLANQGGDYMIVVNDAGDFPLRFDGTTWTTLNADQITVDTTTYPSATVLHGKNLTYVWKYRNRWFFIEGNSMNAWYLGTNAIQGNLNLIPLSGAASKGGKLLFGATWSLDAGDGIDDKCVFATDLGELLIFTGGDPSDPNNWSQQGRYQVAAPMGMNAHLSLGGDLLIATVDGIVPISAAITKDSAQLELAAITVTIKKLWRDEVAAKNGFPWTLKKWDDYGGIFVTTPGGTVGNRYCYVANNATLAWSRNVGWDALCFIRSRSLMFFGTQDGLIMEADQGGTDDGAAYVATLVGNWGMLQQQVSPTQTSVWRQARATFHARASAIVPMQVSGAVDFNVILPSPPLAIQDPVTPGLWDTGLWDNALWDSGDQTPARNTGWISVGQTGYSHAPIIQVLVSQVVKPNIELISIDAVFEPAGVNV
jgi:hypothetical protein